MVCSGAWPGSSGVHSWWLPTTGVALVFGNGGLGVWLGVDVPVVFEVDDFLIVMLFFIMANSSTSNSRKHRRGAEVARVVCWWRW